MAITNFLSEYTCDNCGKTETTYRKYAGPNGWLELKKLVQDYGSAPEDEDYQFCGWACTRKFIENKRTGI
jgi:hypothetical protein